MKFTLRLIPSKSDYQDSTTIKTLTSVLCFEEPERIPEIKDFWQKWQANLIEGDKFTVLAEANDPSVGQRGVGVVRFWQSPFCNRKWLIEGLEVIQPERRKGIALEMIKLGLMELKNRGVSEIRVHIRRNNAPSIGVHKKLGFTKVQSDDEGGPGVRDSFGNFNAKIDEYRLLF